MVDFVFDDTYFICSRNLSGIFGGGKSQQNLRKAVLMLTIGIAIFVWFILKNGNFLLGILHRQPFEWIVPLGISFYTLQILSYLIDIYKGKIKAQKNFAKYILFILFFPQIIQGPIPRYEQLAEQIYEGHLFDESKFVKGFQLIVWGFFLKFMIADKSAIVVNTVFDSPEKYAGCYVLVAGILYSIELYADFLSCVTISQGVAKLFGIDLVNNFMQPYFSTSTKEFWRRWHISFSEWLRDYVYIPLGGSRKGKISQYSNLIITFAVSGVWHGSGYKYLFWGLLHAAYQIVGNVTFGVKEKIYDFLKLSKQSGARKMLQRMGCFFWVMLAWIIFRANSLKTGFQMIKNMFMIHNPWIFFNDKLFSLGLEWKEWGVLLISIIILIYVSSRRERGLHLSEIILSRSIYVRWLIYISIILSIMVFGTYGYGFNVQDFIYGGF